MEKAERCLVVPRKALFGYNDECAFNGFRAPEQLGFDLETVLERHSSFGWRKTLGGEYNIENDDSFKHFVANGIFIYEKKIFTSTRIGGEPRLLDRNDILISGHVNPEDRNGSYQQSFLNTLRREFNEEIEYTADLSIDPLPFGYINDDSDGQVGRVHFGVIYLMQGNSSIIYPKETEILEGSLKTIEEIENLAHPLQSWQKYVFEEVKKYI